MKVLTSAVALLALSACTTTLDSNKVDYKSQGQVGPGLEVPPDLTQITKSAQALVPASGAANASTFLAAAPSAPVVSSTIVATAQADIRVEREGTQRWLVVNRPPEKLWDEVRQFWVDSGFNLLIDQPNLGIMETDWNENRAKIPQDALRKVIGKIVDGLYSTHERDKFRTRMERAANGGTEIYISHRGLTEDFVTKDFAQLKWKQRPIDPELEVEFLKRLMARLSGADPKVALDKANAAMASSTSKVDGRAKVIADGTLLVNDTFDQAWRRVGLSLDRTNFTVEDRDRSKGIYFVRYVESENAKEAPGFFARMFGAKASDPLQKYQILVAAQANQTKVVVASSAGVVLNTADAKNILKVLADDLQ
jgi:outer membrane protein assembly factor BamC